jgi:hypothetical protein
MVSCRSTIRCEDNLGRFTSAIGMVVFPRRDIAVVVWVNVGCVQVGLGGCSRVEQVYPRLVPSSFHGDPFCYR